MKKYYQLAMALVIAAASLTSCSRSTYSFNTAAPAYLGTQPVKSVVKATPAPAATEAVAVAPAKAAVAAPAKAVAAAPVNDVTVAPAKAVAVAPAPVAQAPTAPAVAEVAPLETEAVATAPVVKAAKPSLVQRLVLKKMAKQVAKIQQLKQAAANTKHAASRVGRSILVALAGVLLVLIGLIIAGGSLSGGSGAGFAIGVVLIYLGYIAFLVGLVLLVIALINGN